MSVQIFLGTGGVGKTSVAAATALKSSLAGGRNLVLTIDPAQRLKTALAMNPSGVEQRVPLQWQDAKGELWAAILDVRASLDRAVNRYAKPDDAKAILTHPVYQLLITSLAGMQELLAIERIHQAMEDKFDSIFIDTAPSRHALEFLDKPEFFAQLVSFPIVRLVGRTYQWWIHSPMARISRMTFDLYARVEELLGAKLVHEVLDFFSLFHKIAEGYAERAQQTLKLLRDPKIASFTVVSTPSKARRDADFFAKELEKRKFPIGGMVVNRVWPDLRSRTPQDMPAQLQQLVSWYDNVCGSQQKIWEEVSRTYFGKYPRIIRLPELPRDVDGLPALYEIAQNLA
jgi:anion-transporting  ArsA/GET3 family ATPase